MRPCEVCEERFAGNRFINSSTCRYCVLQSLGTDTIERIEKLENENKRLRNVATEYIEQMRRMKTEHAEQLKKFDKQSKLFEGAMTKIAALEDFIAENIGRASGAAVADATAISPERPTATADD